MEPYAGCYEVHGEDLWCAREDLNLQSFRNQILSLARLPFRHARNLHQNAPVAHEAQAAFEFFGRDQPAIARGAQFV